MFESFKHWFEATNQESQLFERPNSLNLHIALAALLYHVISADGLEHNNEKQEFTLIMAKEFQLSEQQSMVLYHYVKNLKSDLKSDLFTIDKYLKKNPNLRMAFMDKLNQLIGVDGVDSEELNIYYETWKVAFPDLVQQLRDK